MDKVYSLRAKTTWEWKWNRINTGVPAYWVPLRCDMMSMFWICNSENVSGDQNVLQYQYPTQELRETVSRGQVVYWVNFKKIFKIYYFLVKETFKIFFPSGMFFHSLIIFIFYITNEFLQQIKIKLALGECNNPTTPFRWDPNPTGNCDFYSFFFRVLSNSWKKGISPL